MLSKPEELLVEAYWNLRKFSIVEFPDNLKVVFRDSYILLCNLETYFKYDSSGNFENELEKKIWIYKHVDKYKYTLFLNKEVSFTKMRARTIRDFCFMYSEPVPKLERIIIKCNKAGITPPKDLNYRISKRWFTYPNNIKELKSDIILTDLILKKEK